MMLRESLIRIIVSRRHLVKSGMIRMTGMSLRWHHGRIETWVTMSHRSVGRHVTHVAARMARTGMAL